jgi:SAM-dependent methyltransferase
MTKFLSKIGSSFTRIIKNPIRETHALAERGKHILMQFQKSSIISSEDDLFTASSLPNKLIDKALETFQPQSILDLGCGTGQAVSYFLSQGITDIIGIEGSTIAIAKSKVFTYLMQFDLNQELNLGRKFDMIFSYEFVEHIHPDYLDNLLKSFSNHSDIIVLSAAKPGQGGLGHFNEQHSEYWIEAFQKYSYEFDLSTTLIFQQEEETYPDNILVFKRISKKYQG